MRRLALIVAATALTVGALPATAFATTPTPVVSYKGLPSGWDGATINCAAATEGSPTVAHVTGPGTPPLGTGSLKISESNSDTLFEIPFLTDPALSTLAAFDASFYEPASGGLTPTLDIGVTDGSTHYLLVAPGSGTGAWQTVDTTTATMGWVNFDTDTPVGSGTLAQFETAHPSAILGALLVTPGQSCSTGAFYLDALHYSVNGTESLTDFEAPLPTALVNGTHPTSVLTGQSVTLSATLTQSGAAFAGQPVQLWARRTGATKYTVLKTVNTDANGKVSAVVAPTATTGYQWRYAATGNNYAPVNASAYFVTARQRVAISSRSTLVAYRGYAVIKGRVTPYKAGVTVRLVRIVSGRQIVVGTARTLTGGYFTIKAPMTVRGLATYEVTALAYTGEAGGQSYTFKITTR